MERLFYLPRYDGGRMHHASRLANRFSHSRQLVLALVLVAFAWLQFAGMAHKYAHASVTTNQATEVVGGHSLGKLFPDHSQQNKSDCQLFDLQCSGAALSQAMPVLALAVLSLQTLWHKVATFSTSTRLVYQARAPPKPLI